MQELTVKYHDDDDVVKSNRFLFDINFSSLIHKYFDETNLQESEMSFQFDSFE
jgi:hypothetical protein